METSSVQIIITWQKLPRYKQRFHVDIWKSINFPFIPSLLIKNGSTHLTFLQHFPQYKEQKFTQKGNQKDNISNHGLDHDDFFIQTCLDVVAT